jgi:hypothetical protein
MNQDRHILLHHARRYDCARVDLSPAGCQYDIRIGAWILKDSDELVVNSVERPRPPQSKKNDVETGEDQKGY